MLPGWLPRSPSIPGSRPRVPRVYGFGLVSGTHQSAGAQLVGVAPDTEQKITRLQSRMAKGTYLTAATPKGVVMGDQLATTLGVAVGSEIVVLTPAADGSTGNDLYTVSGLFHTGLESMDGGLVLMPLATLQDLLRLSPGRIHEVGIKLHDIADAEGDGGNAATEIERGSSRFESAPWQMLAPELADYVQFNRRVTFILFFIFFALAAMGIVNTMLMAIIERTREFGMLMAVGMRPIQVVGLIVAEAAGLAAASLILGAAIGIPILWYLQVHGLNLGLRTAARSLVAGICRGPLSGTDTRISCPTREAAIGLVDHRISLGALPRFRGRRDSDRPMRCEGSSGERNVPLLVKIGWRNLWRNPRGTLLTALALGLGLTLLLVSLGLLDGSHEQMVANGINFGAGHIVIQAKGFPESGSTGIVAAQRDRVRHSGVPARSTP